MKKSIILTALLAVSISSLSQVPQSFSYQAVIRNSNGTVKANESVSIQVAIIQGSIEGHTVYEEVHDTMTSPLGLLTLNIGRGTSSQTFSDIDWSQGPYFIDITVDGTHIGASQLLSVPYALHARTVEAITETDPSFNNWDKSTGISINESQVTDLQSYLTSETDPGFSSSVSAGITQSDTAKWNAASIGEFTETDPFFTISQASGITQTDIDNLANLSGINTGDQDLSSFATQETLEDTALAIRKDIPDVSGFIDNESDPIYNGWDKDYEDLTNKPVTISTSQADAIVANSGKDTTGIYHTNRAAVDLVSGINTGDQSLSLNGNDLTISNGNTVAIPDEVDDADADPTNEIQDIVYVNDTLKITGGSSFLLPMIPVGTILPYAGISVPAGWILCDGAELSRIEYARLYSTLGSVWGQGDGSSTFNLPDLRGMFLRGVDNGAGNDPNASDRAALNTGGNIGDNVGSYQNDEIESHSHTIQARNGGSGLNNIASHASEFASLYQASTDSFGGAETRPKNVYVTYIIKY
ncbi:MAG: tail fiber protein [Bacteroidota bacterium]